MRALFEGRGPSEAPAFDVSRRSRGLLSSEGDLKRFPMAVSEDGVEKGAGRLRKILVPIKFSSSCSGALEQAVALGSQCEVSLTLLHVFDINTAMAGAGESVQVLMRRLWVEGLTRMEGLASSLKEIVEVETLVQEGLPWEQIVEQSRNFDLVVMAKGWKRRGFKLFARHTLERVLEHARCPVLVVPGKEGGASRSRF